MNKSKKGADRQTRNNAKIVSRQLDRTKAGTLIWQMSEAGGIERGVLAGTGQVTEEWSQLNKIQIQLLNFVYFVLFCFLIN